jgi:hypothetical protein
MSLQSMLRIKNLLLEILQYQRIVIMRQLSKGNQLITEIQMGAQAMPTIHMLTGCPTRLQRMKRKKVGTLFWVPVKLSL